MKYILSAITLFLLTSLSPAAVPDGLVSFYVNEAVVTVVRQYGILDIESRLTEGGFQFVLNDENGSTDYEVTLIDDANPTAHALKNRQGSGFSLVIWRLTAGEQTFTAIPYDPEALCTVTVNRVPPPE